jgi:hypothetical protein
MAWTCQRCLKNIFAPRRNSRNYAMEFKYIRSKGELSYELRELTELKDNAVVTHLTCDLPEVEGYQGRVREILKMPTNSVHPLLD